jgi:hypothetical protein
MYECHGETVINGEQVKTWKEAFLVNLTPLSRHSLGEPKESYKISQSLVGSPNDFQEKYLPNTNLETCRYTNMFQKPG